MHGLLEAIVADSIYFICSLFVERLFSSSKIKRRHTI